MYHNASGLQVSVEIGFNDSEDLAAFKTFVSGFDNLIIIYIGMDL